MRAILILLGVLAVGLPDREAYAQIPACGEATEPTCDGFCTTPGETCTGFGGFCGCFPSGGGGCGMIAGSPLCIGECPLFEACFSVAGVCECRPDPPACGEAVEPTCDGFCTTPGETCTGFGGFCGCFPSGGGGCGMIAGSPLCIGECPLFEACFSVAGVCTCRGASGFCGDGATDPGESCDAGAANGSAGSCCNGDCTFRSSGATCRPAASDCDVAETCSGSSGTCPADGFQANGSSCDDGDACTNPDQCQSGSCLGNPNLCGDGITQGACGEECDDGNTSDGDGCSADCEVEGSAVPILQQWGQIAFGAFLLGTALLVLRRRLHMHIRTILLLAGVLAVLPLGNEAYPQIPACGEAVSPTCDGFCTTPGETCISLGGGCGCLPDSGAGPCGSLGPPLCGGECPPFEACFSVAGVCECRPDPPPCGAAVSPACDGFCATPGETCISLGGGCGCLPDSGAGPCGSLGPPLCGGECPPFEACFSVAGVCECRGAAGFCGDGTPDPGEQCDAGGANGTSGSCCNADCTFRSSGATCRPAAGVCDVAETCSGSGGACPADGFAANGSSCDDGDVCTIEDQCLNGACVGNLESCGNGTLEPSCGEECDDGNTVGGDGCSADCLDEGAGVPILPGSSLLLLAALLLGTSLFFLQRRFRAGI